MAAGVNSAHRSSACARRGTLHAAMNDPTPLEPPLRVACLCAAWCGTCRDYAPLLAGLAARFGPRVCTRWIDIEDDAELVDSVDVENFPTLLITRGTRVLFFGTVLPHASTLERLTESALANELAAPAFDDDTLAEAVGALARRLDVAAPPGADRP